MAKFWLLKAEPDTRIVKGKDVKFSVDDFESVKTSPWEGVRNYEARNLMKEMQKGEKALFYHSNCKVPGIAGFAEVSKEAYPDFTAWDPAHPYYDPKTDQDDPRWFMVELTFKSRAQNFVPLALLRYIADNSTLPPEIEYIGDTGAKAIKAMDLVTRGRLSVQRVDGKAWDTIVQLAEKGGWEELDLKPKKGGAAPRQPKKEKVAQKKEKPPPRPQRKRKVKEEEESENESESESWEEDGDNVKKAYTPQKAKGSTKRRKTEDNSTNDLAPRRRSTRAKA
ncbi:PUA-like domain-containing protein [Collybia nuda]|uniref:PUA-like domain-containing protein n=1 Tax=Collybia nuda TaxID=64659 RepID=A0A9P6CDQ3_9AGAR|nr:PUA-like domain-containing protein [Collybia nuda]